MRIDRQRVQIAAASHRAGKSSWRDAQIGSKRPASIVNIRLYTIADIFYLDEDAAS
jgi:hypothetical protein